MSDHLSQIPGEKKKILEKSPMSGVAVPIAIVLVGLVIIFGVTKMLSNDNNYKNLVEELHSKTFGNRWVAAFELSKVISSKQIPETEIPWLIENLSFVYKKSIDARTRNFIILALASLKNPSTLETLNLALKDQDEKVRFNAVVAMGNMPQGVKVDWQILEELTSDKDPGLQQASIYALANHKIASAEGKIMAQLQNADLSVRFSAAIALVSYSNHAATKVLEEIFTFKNENNAKFNDAQVEALRLNVLNAIAKNKAKNFNDIVQSFALKDSNLKVSTKAQEVLNLLKN